MTRTSRHEAGAALPRGGAASAVPIGCSKPAPAAGAARPARGSRFRPASAVMAAFLPLLFLLVQAGPSTAGSGAAGKVVVLVLDRVSATQFPTHETPFCNRLASDWSFGLMVARTAGSRLEPGAGHLTLGMGAPSRGARDAALSFNSGERFNRGDGSVSADEMYAEFSGFTAPAGGVVCLGWQQLVRANFGTGSREDVDTLASELEGARKRCAVLGNSDFYGQPARFAPLICAGAQGIVPRGDVAGPGIPSPDSPGGVMTDYGRLAGQVREMLDSVDVLVVDTGDTARIDREQAASTEQATGAHRRTALRRFDRFASDVARHLDLRESLLIIVSPGPPEESVSGGSFLTPFIAAGRGFSSGLLTSASTRRPGLVSNTDFMPTVLSFYGLAVPARAVGSPMEPSGSRTRPGDLQRLAAQVPETLAARWPIVLTGGSLAIVISVISVLCGLAGQGRLSRPASPARPARVIAPASLVLLAAPLACIVVSAFTYRGYAFPALFCSAFSLIAGLGAWGLSKMRRGPDPVAVLGLLTAAVIIADQFAGGRLMLLPLVGSGGLEGLRFFGLTNLTVGILLAMTLWAAAGIMRAVSRGAEGRKERRFAKALVFATLAGVALFVGLGALGANLGGFVTAAVTFLVFAFALSKRGLTRFKAFLAVPAAVVLGVGAVVAVDAAFFRTHASRSLDEGAGRLIPILGRKLAIHAGEIEYFLVPALLLIAAVLAAALWIRKPGSWWEERWHDDPERTAALYAILTGGLVGLVVNDTGITLLVAMALISTLAWSYYASSASFGAGARRTPAAPSAATPGG